MVLEDTAFDRRTLHSIGGHCVRLKDTAFGWRTLYTIGGHCLRLKDTAFDWRTLYSIGGHSLRLKDTAFDWRTLYWIAGCLDLGVAQTSVGCMKLCVSSVCCLNCLGAFAMRRILRSQRSESCILLLCGKAAMQSCIDSRTSGGRWRPPVALQSHATKISTERKHL
jgi:hypothetical protein